MFDFASSWQGWEWRGGTGASRHFLRPPAPLKQLGEALEPLQMSTPQLESWKSESFESFQNLVFCQWIGMLLEHFQMPTTRQLDQKAAILLWPFLHLAWLDFGSLGLGSWDLFGSGNFVCLWEWGVCNCWQNFIDVLDITQWVFTV